MRGTGDVYARVPDIFSDTKKKIYKKYIKDFHHNTGTAFRQWIGQAKPSGRKLRDQRTGAI